MATLILSTGGTALGGPIGGLIGTIVGQTIDQQLLGGGPRRGPRLGDLSVQTSSYGSMIPRMYGTMRVAGTVIWAADLVETSELQGDGKSQPEAVVYSYSASFAVALSSREAASIGRIWADGKLLRGAAGDFKTQCKFRFLSGSEGQAVDPLIATIEGVGTTPAYRGLALAVFEDLMLGDYGNRIPNLTFELIADADEIGLGDILRDASEGLVDCADTRAVAGYALYGQDLGSAVMPLVEAFSADLNDDGEAFRGPAAGTARMIEAKQMGASAEASAGPLVERSLAAATTVPTALTLTYYEPERDFQAGQARSSFPSVSRVRQSIALPCALDAASAKGLADSLLARAWAVRDRLVVRLTPDMMDLAPGDVVQPAGVSGSWVVDQLSIEGMVVIATLRPAAGSLAGRVADGGRPVSQPDVVALPTALALFDLSDLGDDGVAGPSLQLAAASPSGGYRAVPIRIDINGVSSASQSAAGESVLGVADTALAPGQSVLVDLESSVEVTLINPEHWLQSCDDVALAAGANLAAIGDELIQFGSAEPVGAKRFRLSRLLRGRRGSEWAIGAHAVGEPFALIDARTLKAIPVGASGIGSDVAVTAYGPGNDSATPVVTRVVQGEAARQLSPAQLQAEVAADGSLAVRWVRRSRRGWAWIDEVDVPTDPDLAGYRITLTRAGASVDYTATDTSLTLSAAEFAALGSGPLSIAARQVGSIGLSRPAMLTINA
ncbi:MAG: phage tail protein [Sphingomicrobium sp.]